MSSRHRFLFSLVQRYCDRKDISIGLLFYMITELFSDRLSFEEIPDKYQRVILSFCYALMEKSLTDEDYYHEEA